MDPIIVPDSAVEWIRLHRTKFRDLPADEVKAAYAASVEADYEAMKPWLPKKCRAWLDIGAGMAGIDVLLRRHYRMSRIHLMDGTGRGPNMVGYQKGIDLYNSMPAALELLAANGIKSVGVHEPDPSATIECDLIVSLLSWGHHYPAETYLPLVMRSLRPGGRLILDLRKGQNGHRVISKSLAFLGIVSEHKSDRVCFERTE